MAFDAVPPLRTAFQLAPDDARKETVNLLLDAFFGAAASEFKNGNFSGSIDFLKEAMKIEPQSSQARDELVRSLIAFGGQL
jgi:hypothetical protein